jgi:ATP-dependent HslUV protease subunit HslV
MAESQDPTSHGTTILSVRKGRDVVIAGDGQVTMGPLILKSNVSKIRRLGKGDVKGGVVVGFTGSTSDSLVLFERLESLIDQNPHQLVRACVDLAKEWRKDTYVRDLEAMLAVVSPVHSLILTGAGDVLEPEDGIIGIGSGGPYALSAARALIDIEGYTAEMIVRKAMGIAAQICVFTNLNVVLETLEI